MCIFEENSWVNCFYVIFVVVLHGPPCDSMAFLYLLITGLLRVLESPWIFSRFSRPGKSLKTNMVLESAWICVWRSLKVLELDFLKRSALLLVEGFWGPEIYLECVVGWGSVPDPAGGAHDAPPDTPVGWGFGNTRLQEPHPPRRLQCLDSRAYTYISFVWSLKSPWKVLEFDFDKWARTL